ncbi:hypothetical protein [Stackebrandtia nassauensis]|uniref:Uncharacterized protein n=1 Tax=Stackebrandtia nassauensis (strain DSM 44728 / CIP 108903 / NRRL B-16338 / NBRC 102104 / LLR-40K-21) TaxID=446470 RepID=D3PX87_STANL|nr:hypothetical protein [Stackebrandtia nassauensis]ADD41350.1 hypothetical protein Snas_1647 [Stackebrandtia nassauensis DSM 44728]
MGDENSRIETLDKQLAALLRKATDEQRRAAALAICSLAAHRTKLDDSRVDVAREALAGGTVGDCPEREAVVKLAIEWDEQAWAVQETDTAEYQRAFAKARAAAGFESAFDPDSYVAAGEAAYEASYAIGDAETVRVAVAKILS